MIQNYLIIALRNFRRNKIFSFINVAGLSVGITACLLIFSYASYELSYDSFHENAGNLYRIQLNRYQNGKLLQQNAISNTALAPAMQREIPEVINFSRGGIEECLIYYEDVKFNDLKVFWVDETFINLFPLQMLQGNPEKALADPFTAVLSQTQARKFFGDEDPLGKSVVLNEGLHFMVTGVFADLPANSHMQLDVLMSMATGYDMGWATRDGNWRSEWVYNYIQLTWGTDPATVEAKIPALLEKYQPDLSENNIVNEYKLQPITSIHLESQLNNELTPNGSKKTVHALLLIAFLILVIAWINFVNLSTAKSMERAREIGIRKTIGARKHQLISQFILEAFLVNFLSLLLAIVLVWSLYPLFIQIVAKPLSLSIIWQSSLLGVLILFFFSGTILSGLYPAFLLSGFQPIKVLKGKVSSGRNGFNLRQGLVIIQFAVSIGLIVGTTVIIKQIRYMQQQELGADIDQVLVLYTPKTLNMDTTRYQWFNSFQETLRNQNEIKYMAASNVLPGEEISFRTENVRLIGGEIAEERSYAIANVSSQYLNCFDIRLLAGRNFKADMEQDRQAIIINEMAMQAMGIKHAEDAIDRTVQMGSYEYRIVGVINNYHHEGLRAAIEPMIFRHWYNYLFGYYSFKLNTGNLKQTIGLIEAEWKKIFPIAPFDYFFLDSFFNQQYQNDIRLSRIIGLFTLLAVIIACLGLFGLTSYTILQRTKEIGIRKVNGARVIDILWLFSKDFSRWLLVAVIVTAPVIYVLMKRWLTSFAYQVGFDWWIIVMAGLAMLIIALLSVGIQIIKASRTNPVEALRYE